MGTPLGPGEPPVKNITNQQQYCITRRESWHGQFCQVLLGYNDRARVCYRSCPGEHSVEVAKSQGDRDQSASARWYRRHGAS